MERIGGGEGVVAIILAADDHAEGAWFLTGAERAHQLGVLARSEGYHVPAHRHPAPTGPVEGDPVTVIVTGGCLRVSIEHADAVHEREIDAGGAVMLFAGSMTITAVGDAEYTVIRRSDEENPPRP